MKVCVLAAGSLGSAIGGTLALAGNEVHFVSRPAHVAAINEHGLIMVGGAEDRVAPVSAHETPDGIGPCDLVLVLSKTLDTESAIQGIESLVGPDTMVLSLQNGLGAEDILIEAVGEQHVIGGKTYIGGMLLGPGRVQATTAGKRTIVGELDGTVTARVQAVSDMFNDAGMECTVSDNIQGVIWDKLLINVATGAVCSITGLPYGDIYDEPAIEKIGLAAVQEGMDVAAAKGIALTFDDPWDSWDLARQNLPDNFKPSMLQSLEKGRPTEVDFIAGAVVSEGAKVGVPTPINEILVAFVHGIERRIRVYGK